MGFFGSAKSLKIVNLDEMYEKKDVSALMAVLSDKKHRNSQPRATYYLGKLKAPRAIKVLIGALKNDEMVGNPDGDYDYFLRNAAYEALELINHPDAAAPLAELLKSSDKDLSWRAFQLLKKLDWQPPTSESGIVYLLMSGKYTQIAGLKDKVHFLTAIDNNPNYDSLRMGVIETMKLIGGQWAVSVYIHNTFHHDIKVKLAAIKALGGEKDYRVFNALIDRVRPGEPELNNAILEALVQIGPDAILPINNFVKTSRDAFARSVAQEALSRIQVL